jgi:hypothetical protein
MVLTNIRIPAILISIEMTFAADWQFVFGTNRRGKKSPGELVKTGVFL